jgi:hypothetical protein
MCYNVHIELADGDVYDCVIPVADEQKAKTKALQPFTGLEVIKCVVEASK